MTELIVLSALGINSQLQGENSNGCSILMVAMVFNGRCTPFKVQVLFSHHNLGIPLIST